LKLNIFNYFVINHFVCDGIRRKEIKRPMSALISFCWYAFFKVLGSGMIEKKDFTLSFIIGTVSGVVLAKFALFVGGQF